METPQETRPQLEFYVYILRCADGTLYTGSTNNLAKRLHQHNFAKNGAHYTKIRRPVELQYFERCTSLAEGRKREAEIKRFTRQQKEALISSAILQAC